jgi:adenine-specific DNA-methyltransferase
MKTAPSLQKLRGGYYTPEAIAVFLADWAIQKPNAKVLEPSCGDGTFVEAAARRLSRLGANASHVRALVHGVEFDATEAAKAEARFGAVTGFGSGKRIHVGDFFEYCRDGLKGQGFDAILGNPPFIRFQNFPEVHREAAFDLMRAQGLHPTRLTNSWLPFIAVCIGMLSEHGRLAMVVPAELLQVNYAAELRQFLSDRCHRLTIFTFRRLVFDDIQQEVVLLCAERDGVGAGGIRTIELEDLGELPSYEHPPFDARDLKPMYHSKEKWTQYFLSSQQIHLLREIRKSPRLDTISELADVEVGVVTGLNDFFVLRQEAINRLEAKNHVLRLVSRSGHLKGLFFKQRDWAANAEAGFPAYLLTLADVPIGRLPKTLAKYVRHGESMGWHKGFKCRIRSPWYKVPSAWVPDGFMLRQIHEYPRIFINSAHVTSTDTIHRVRTHDKIDIGRLAGAAYNSLSFAFAEVLGRSYGGGVLELEPREAAQVPVPYAYSHHLDLKRLDAMLRDNEEGAALDYADEILLRRGMGLSKRQISSLRCIWTTLRDRRIGRKKRSRSSPNLT